MTDLISPSDLGIKGSAASPEVLKDSPVVTNWLKEVQAAAKLEKDYRKAAKAVVALFEGESKKENQFNILFSNTETMLPALYNSVPRPVVQRRFKDEDPLGKMASKAGERILKFLIDEGSANYTPFDDLLKSATLEALVPGRGVTRFKYDATLITAQNEAAAEAVESPESETKEQDSGEETPEVLDSEAPEETVNYETVCGEEVPWDRFLHGSAKKWQDVPWISIEHFMTREELEKNFGEIGAKVPVEEATEGGSDDDEIDSPMSDAGNRPKVAHVYEIWDKTEKKVYFISPAWKSAPLKVVDDPLKLSGFYPIPRPMTFMLKIKSLVPTIPYVMYEEQAKELNRITVRINKLIAALKVRGLYDSTVEGLDKVLTADDNTLVPAQNVAALLAQGNSLEKSVWLMPIEKLVAVLQQLYLQRQQVKTVIYEITGIADIMRGSTQASETLGAQQLKNQWGTLRLKRMQKEVQRYARDCLRLMMEIAVSQLSPETIKRMTGLPYPMGAEKQQAQAILQQVQVQGQQAMLMAQQTGQQPPPPPQIQPQVQAAASLPSWEEILAMLQDDVQRNYRVDIETNSTVDAEATEDQKNISELLNAISQFLNGVGPMVQDGTMPFEVAQGMLLAITRRFQFGPELEDLLKQMKPPQPAGQAEDAAKQKAEVEKALEQLKQGQAELEKQKATALQEVAKQQQQLQQAVDKANADLDLERREFELQKQFAQKELAMEKQFADKELALKQQIATASHEITVQKTEQKLALKASAQGEQLKQQSEAVAGKAKEVAQKEQKLDPAVLMQPVVKMLSDSFQGMGEQLAEVLTTVKKPKRAVKAADGSWSTHTVEKDAK